MAPHKVSICEFFPSDNEHKYGVTIAYEEIEYSSLNIKLAFWCMEIGMV